MSERNASILSKLVAMTLSMAGPRLWILIKAFFFWTIGFCKRRYLFTRTGHVQSDLFLISSSSTSTGQDIPLRNFAISDGHDTIKNSHSELGAALDLMKGVWTLLKIDRIELSTTCSSSEERQTWSKIGRLWNNFLRQPADILVSLLISAALVGLFVAQSSGSVLSASVVSDTTALLSSSKCTDAEGADRGSFSRAVTYVKQCYRVKDEADGCNYFYNQSIAYLEKSDQTCPFLAQTCALGRSSAMTFDTGFIDAKFLGINAAKRYQFRRKTSCAPLVPDGIFLKVLPPMTFPMPNGSIDYAAGERRKRIEGMRR